MSSKLLESLKVQGFIETLKVVVYDKFFSLNDFSSYLVKNQAI
jgi:hypothetical protein